MGAASLLRNGSKRRQRFMGRARLFLGKSIDAPEIPVGRLYGSQRALERLEEDGLIQKRKSALVIGLTGPSGVGKTEIVKHLLDQHGFVSTHVGWPVKKALMKGFKLKKSDVDGSQKVDSCPNLGGVEPKLVLDHMGEALARTAPLATALALGRKLDKMRRKHNLIVVDGVRQQPEADLIHRRGGYLLRVDDGRGPDPKYPMDKRAYRIPADHNIDTSGTVAQSRQQIDQFLAKCKLAHPAYYAKARVEELLKDADVGDVHVDTALGNQAKRKVKRYPPLSLARAAGV